MPPPITAPRRPPAYNNRDHGHSTRSSGVYILKSSVVDVVVKKPSWDGTETVFRPYPCPAYEGTEGEFEPYRLDPGGSNFHSDWIRRYDCAWGVGNPGQTFIVNDPAVNAHFDPWATPLGQLYSAISKACDEHQGRPEWYPLLKAGKGKGKALSPPQEFYIMQGFLPKHDDKPCVGSDRMLLGWGKEAAILLISGGTGRTLKDMLAEEVKEYRGDPADYEARYTCGDPVGVKNGRWIHLYEAGNDPRLRYAAQPTVRGVPGGLFAAQGPQVAAGNPAGAQTTKIGYEMYLAKDWDGNPAVMDTEFARGKILTSWRYWDDILWFPTELEQAQRLAMCFPPSALVYAWEGMNSDWLTAEIRQAAVNAESARIAAAPSQPGQPGMMFAPPVQPGGVFAPPPAQPIPFVSHPVGPHPVGPTVIPPGPVQPPAFSVLVGPGGPPTGNSHPPSQPVQQAPPIPAAPQAPVGQQGGIWGQQAPPPASAPRPTVDPTVPAGSIDEQQAGPMFAAPPQPSGAKPDAAVALAKMAADRAAARKKAAGEA